MKVKGYRLLVVADPVETKTDSGIIIQMDEQKAKLNQMYGTVYDVGEECWGDQEPWCKPGDRIVWSKFAGKFVVDSDDTEYVILNDQDVLAVL